MIERTKALLHLSLIPGIGPAKILKIVGSKDFDRFLSYSKRDFMNLFGFSEKVTQALSDGLKDRSLLEEKIRLIEKHKINLVSIFDDEYPDVLKEIFLPPPILYCIGASLATNDKKVAIVGARKAKSYARDVCDDLVGGLVTRGWDTVSGGAIGVDTMVHCATLNSGGRTVVVLGSGLMVPYPSENKRLFREVVEKGGTLVSPFPLTLKPFPGNFPARNRIISGLSRGCLVVQAAEKSGALITARFALEQGRHVFAVPGSIFDNLSVGCHNLISEGAKVVSSSNDILEEFGESVESISSSKVGSSENSDPIIECLKEALSIDELTLKLNMDVSVLQDRLFELQIAGKVQQNFAGYWERV